MKSGFSSKKGFTLIESLVALGLFSLLTGLILGIFSNSLVFQQRSLVQQGMVAELSYSLEYMSRALRMARKDTAGNCISQNHNYEMPNNNPSAIRFLNYEGKCQQFYFGNNSLWVKKSTDGSFQNLGNAVLLTSPNVEVLTFKIAGFGWSQNDNLQPRVTFVLEAQGRSLRLKPRIALQTTISQRNIDVKK